MHRAFLPFSFLSSMEHVEFRGARPWDRENRHQFNRICFVSQTGCTKTPDGRTSGGKLGRCPPFASLIHLSNWTVRANRSRVDKASKRRTNVSTDDLGRMEFSF